MSDLVTTHKGQRCAAIRSILVSPILPSQNPITVWNERFRIDVPDDRALLDAPLEFRVWDHDVMTADDEVGHVFLDLAPLMLPDGSHSISGWMSVIDTLHGLRGEIELEIKLKFFGDVNPFKELGHGVRVFGLSGTPSSYALSEIHGFVEELIVDNDPEYHWSDTFRSPRVSNEARQLLLHLLEGRVKRALSRKSQDIGANAIIGYRLHFDLENEFGIVARAYGTAVKISNRSKGRPRSSKQSPGSSPPGSTPSLISSPTTEIPTLLTLAMGKSGKRKDDWGDPFPIARFSQVIPLKNRHQESSAPKEEQAIMAAPQEVQLISMQSFPPGVLAQIGGVVTARSVKLLVSRNRQTEHDTWWNAVRDDVRAHAAIMGCAYVVGYEETATVQDDLCVISATGTAANLNLQFSGSGHPLEQDEDDEIKTDEEGEASEPRGAETPPVAPDEDESIASRRGHSVPPPLDHTATRRRRLSDSSRQRRQLVGSPLKFSPGASPVRPDVKGKKRARRLKCAPCHVPYRIDSVPFPLQTALCGVCKRRHVPELLLATIEPPPGLPVIGEGRLIEARILRPKKKGQGETNAKSVSDSIPFVEYEVHKQLATKLRLLDSNAVFGLRIHITVGETVIVGVATGTAVLSSALPRPAAVSIDASEGSSPERVAYLRQELDRIGLIHRALRSANLIHSPPATPMPLSSEIGTPTIRPPQGSGTPAWASTSGVLVAQSSSSSESSSSESSSGESEDERPGGAIVSESAGRTVGVELDDNVDEDALGALLDPVTPDWLSFCTTETLPGEFTFGQPLQTVSSLIRVAWDNADSQAVQWQLGQLFTRLYMSLTVKLIRLRPVCVCAISVDVQQPDEDELQVSVTGMAMSRVNASLELPPAVGTPLEHPRTIAPDSQPVEPPSPLPLLDELASRPPPSARHDCEAFSLVRSLTCRSSVLVTALSTLPGYSINQFLGRIYVHSVRESFSVREDGGLGAFVQACLMEVSTLLRVRVAAMSGNALLGMKTHAMQVDESSSKNQAYVMVSVSGDAVVLSGLELH